MNFQLSSTASTGSFDLLDAQASLITHFQYENWFSSTGSATLKDSRITIKPRNIWHSSFDVFSNDEDKGDITFNWQGHILIRLQNRAGNQVGYRLKGKGLWNFRFVLKDEQDTVICQLIPAFKWSKMSYNYTIEFAENPVRSTELDLVMLLLACGYGANLYMTMIAASAS